MLNHCSLENPGVLLGSLRSLLYLPINRVPTRLSGSRNSHRALLLNSMAEFQVVRGCHILDGWICADVTPRLPKLVELMFLMRCLKDINYGIWSSKLISYVCVWDDLQSSWKHLPWDLRSPLGFSWFHSEVHHSHTFLGRSNVEERSGGAIFAGEAMVSCVATSLRQCVVK